MALSTFQIERVSSAARPAASNKLLASLPAEDYRRIAPHLRRVPIHLRQVLHRQDEAIEHVYFPNGGACSLVRTLQDGQTAEVATIGAEGAIGTNVFFGHRTAECDVVVRVPAAAVALTTEAFNREMERRGAFFNRVIRYNQALMSQIMQTTACNSLHSADARCCRWLLMTHDRAGRDAFALSRQFLAAVLGIRRPAVTIVVASLEARGFIRYQRGVVTIADRGGLESASCECYHRVKSTWERLLPELSASLAPCV